MSRQVDERKWNDSHGIYNVDDVPLPGYHKEEALPAVGIKFDSGKLRFGLIPPEAEKALAEVLTFGAKKYAPDNWRKIEDKKNRYSDALGRHLNAWRLGEVNDPESGLPHLWHALACMTFLVADTFEADSASAKRFPTEK